MTVLAHVGAHSTAERIYRITLAKEYWKAMAQAAAGEDFGPAQRILESMEKSRRAAGSGITEGDLIPLLQEIQSAYGYLPPRVMMKVSDVTGIPTSRMYGVITFYSQFHIEPHGKHRITFCRGTACHVRGGQKALDAVMSLLGIRDGETTEDMKFSLETVACVGACALSPVMIIGGKYYGKLTARRAEDVLRQLIEDEEENEA